MDIVINYDPLKKEYKLYEPTSKTLIITANLSEAFINLNNFLRSSGKTKGSFLDLSGINYHLDSETMGAIVKSNVDLLKRLQSGPSEFKTSSDKFGMGASGKNNSETAFGNSYNRFGFGKSKFGGGKFSKSKFNEE